VGKRSQARGQWAGVGWLGEMCSLGVAESVRRTEHFRPSLLEEGKDRCGRMLANKTRSGCNDRLDNMANHHSESTSRLNFKKKCAEQVKAMRGRGLLPFSFHSKNSPTFPRAGQSEGTQTEQGRAKQYVQAQFNGLTNKTKKKRERERRINECQR